MNIRNMIFIKRLFYIIVFCSISGITYGQQVPVYSQYIMNGFLINPSLAGRDGYTTVALTAREQWIGMKGGPSTYAASFQTNLLTNSFFPSGNTVRKKPSRPSKSSRVGVGGVVFNDNNGIMRRTGLQADYAYHIPLGGSFTKLSDFALGLGLVAYQYAIKTDNLNYSYNDDPYLNLYDKSVFVTDFNFGASYANEKFYAGFSMTNILRGALIFGNDADNKMGEEGHFFLTGGGNIPLNKEWTLKPSGFLKFSDMVMSSVQFDLTSRIYYKEDYWAGISYRSGDAVILLLGLKYDKYYFGYAFDFTLTDIRNQSIGTMELTLAVKFGESARRYHWLNSL
jgi:type IX secretion system PorP/SprF family membrane protein